LSAAAWRVILVGGGGAPTSWDRRRRREQNVGGGGVRRRQFSFVCSFDMLAIKCLNTLTIFYCRIFLLISFTSVIACEVVLIQCDNQKLVRLVKINQDNVE
jgi:hypothetical protein